MNPDEPPANVTIYLDWWPRNITEIDDPFIKHGWLVEGGGAGRSPRQLGAGPDFTQIVLVASAGMGGVWALTQLIEKVAQSVKQLLDRKKPDEQTGIILDVALDGQTDGVDYKEKWRTGRYLMVTLPPSQVDQSEALDALSRIELPPLGQVGGSYTPWQLMWQVTPYSRWILSLVLPTRPT